MVRKSLKTTEKIQSFRIQFNSNERIHEQFSYNTLYSGSKFVDRMSLSQYFIS